MSKWRMLSFRGAGSSPRARNPYSHAVVMDSGLAALRRSGMTAALAIALMLTGHAAAQDRDRAMATVVEIPLTGDDGQQVANHAVKIPGPIDKLPGVVTVGNPNGKTALVEFYDLNCPYCRIASADIADMVDLDRELKLVLVPFPVLGIPSIQASRIELAVAKLGTPQQFYAFHRKVYAQRGTTDGARALEIAHGLGLDAKTLTKLADSDEITGTMIAHVRLGNSLGLAATPAFIIDGVAILGYPGRYRLQAIVDASDACGKIVC
jgi:protein-disulfide isomerase